jgi:hypothetical protein
MCKWEDNIKRDLQYVGWVVDWIGQEQMGAVVNEAMNLRLHKIWEFLN